MMTNEVEAKQTPLLAGWAIAAGVALVAIGLCVVVFGFSVTQAVFVGLVLLVIVGLVLGMPGKVQTHRQAEAKPVAAQAAAPVAKVEAPVAVAVSEPVKANPVKEAPVKAAPVEVAKPAVVAAAPVAATGAAKRPEALKKARGGKADDLKLIKGVGPKLEKVCNSLGFYHFDQIAAWSGDEIAWVDDNLEGFKGRVTRDDWVAQAKVLAAGGETEFSRKSSKG